MIRVIVPVGKHVIDAKFLDTPIRSIGNAISLISIIVLATMTVISIKGKKHEKT